MLDGRGRKEGMKEPLTKNEIVFMRESIDFYNKFGARMLKSIGVGSVLMLILTITTQKFAPKEAILAVLLGAILSLYFWYVIFKKPARRLEEDVERGVKITKQVSVHKIKTRKGEKNYILSEGFKITESGLQDENIAPTAVKVGQKLSIAFTPRHKMTLNVEISSDLNT